MSSSPESVALSQYNVLRGTFRCLPTSSLKSAAQVCSLWRQVAAVTLRDPERDSRPAVFSWEGDKCPLPEYRQHPLFESPNHVGLCGALSAFVAEMRMAAPATVVSLLSGDVETSIEEKGGLVASFLVDQARLDRLCPAACTSVSLVTDGIVAMDMDSLAVDEVENVRAPLKPAVSQVFFPASTERSQVFSFRVEESYKGVDEAIGERDSKGKKADFRAKLLSEAFGDRLRDPALVKAVVVLTNSHEMAHARFLLQEIGLRTGRRVAIAGAIGNLARASSDGGGADIATLARQFRGVDDNNSCDGDDEHGDGSGTTSTGLIFAGEGVSAASVMLTSDVKTEAKVEAILSELKTLDADPARSVAMMFACCGRGQGLYRKRNLESSVFRRLFPAVPLVGLFGQGEIGVHYVPKKEEEDANPVASKRPKLDADRLFSPDELEHSYTTIFLLVSYAE